MTKYRIYATQSVSTVVEVEAEDFDAAVEKFYTQGMPSLMFVNHTYPDEGDWEIDEEESGEADD